MAKNTRILPIEFYIHNILAAYSLATASDIKAGRNWYRRMSIIVGAYAVRLGITPYMAAGVYGAYSINNGWKDNMRRARGILRHGRPINGLPLQRMYANTAMAGISFDTFVTDSHKVKRFTRNISGDFSCVTVDRWAIRIATGDYTIGRPPVGKEYLAIEEAYIIAAGMVGELPAELQAITWLVARKGN
jgi:hypothetical protein